MEDASPGMIPRAGIFLPVARKGNPASPCENFIFRLRMCILRLRMHIFSLRMYILRLKMCILNLRIHILSLKMKFSHGLAGFPLRATGKKIPARGIMPGEASSM